MNAMTSLFPKLYKGCQVVGLAELVHMGGLDTVNVVIRNGFWVGEDDLAHDLRNFIREMEDNDVAISKASTSFSAAQLIGPDSPLPILQDNGITEFRMGWFPRPDGDIREALFQTRQDLASVAEACEQYGVKAIYQLHHHTLITSPSAAFLTINGLDPTYVGIELDPGNQSFEGFEPWDYACGLLGEYVAWVGVKDTYPWRVEPRVEEAGKGWQREFCPLAEGVTNWQDLVHALAGIEFSGTFVFMPFYEPNDVEQRNAKLVGDIEYLRALRETLPRRSY